MAAVMLYNKGFGVTKQSYVQMLLLRVLEGLLDTKTFTNGDKNI